MSIPDAKQFQPLIERILAASDKDSISAKRVRKQLKAQFPGADIDSNRASTAKRSIERHSNALLTGAHCVVLQELVDGWITKAYTALTASDPTPSGSQVDVKPVLSAAPAKPPKRERELSPIPAKAKLSNSSADITDEQLARLLQAEFERGKRSTRGGDKPRKAPAKSKKRSKATIDSDEDESNAKKRKAPTSVSGFNKPYKLSPALAALVDTDKLSRPTITKRLWVYIKANGLQKESDKRFIVPDERFTAVFGKMEFTSFKMATLLGPHLEPMDADETEQYRQELVARTMALVDDDDD